MLNLKKNVEESSDFHILRKNNPKPRKSDSRCIVTSDDTTLTNHTTVVDSLNASTITSAASKIQGSACPSGQDAILWRRILTSFDRFSDPCMTIAKMAVRIATEYLDFLDAYRLTHTSNACRLIAHNTNPAVMPYGIGEVLRRFLGPT